MKRITPERAVTAVVMASFLSFSIHYGMLQDAIKCIQALALCLLAPVPRLLANKTGVKLGQAMPILWNIFITLAVIGGTFLRIYFIVPQWDKMLHLASGVMVGVGAYNAGETVEERLMRPDTRLQNQIFIAVFAFCAACAVAVVWEIYEFCLDRALDMDCQRYKEGPNSGLMDTMADIILGASGGAIGAAMMCVSARRRIRAAEGG